MALYATGTIVNLVIHGISRLVLDAEPSFFHGYGSWAAIMVNISNVFIGLAITAIYKYSDALVKCLATAVSTGVLLYICPFVSPVPYSFLVVPGTIMIFVATWLYIVESPEEDDRDRVERPVRRVYEDFLPQGRQPYIGMALTSSLCTSIIMWLEVAHQIPPAAEDPPPVEVLRSPFENSLAFIRWNQYLPERIPTIEKYRPFFKDLHISMPAADCTSGFNTTCAWQMDESCGLNMSSTLTADNYCDIFTPYTAVSDTMEHILNSTGDAEGFDGISYYRFDAWLDPMAFSTERFDKIWMMDSIAPPPICMTSVDDFPDWYFYIHTEFLVVPRLLAALQEAAEHLSILRDLRFNPQEWCIG